MRLGPKSILFWPIINFSSRAMSLSLFLDIALRVGFIIGWCIVFVIGLVLLGFVSQFFTKPPNEFVIVTPEERYKQAVIRDSIVYFEYFRDLKKLMDVPFKDDKDKPLHNYYYNHIYTGKPRHSTYTDYINSNEFIFPYGLSKQNTEVLMKHYSNYLNDNKFYPLPYVTYDEELENRLLKDYNRRNNFTIVQCAITPNNFTNISGSAASPYKMNAQNTQLLTETDEDFEIKILENVLTELQNLYVYCKVIEKFGVDYTKSFAHDA
jgi:hypothetical protein